MTEPRQFGALPAEVAKATVRTAGLLHSAACALILAACSNGGDSHISRSDIGGSNAGAGSGVCGQLSSELLVEDKFSQESTTFISGEPIEFDMRITNGSDSPAKLGYDGCPLIRFVVFDARSRNVFDSLPDGTPCTTLLRFIDYAPRETKEFKLEWKQTRSDGGSRVPPGQYTVNARDRSVECAGDLDRERSFTIQ